MSHLFIEPSNVFCIYPLKKRIKKPSILSSINTVVYPLSAVIVKLCIANAPKALPLHPISLKGVTVCSVDVILLPPLFQLNVVPGLSSPFNLAD